MNNNECWELIEKVLGRSRRVLLFGPPGTGKTYSAVKQNAPLNTNGDEVVYQITMTEDTANKWIRILPVVLMSALIAIKTGYNEN